MKSKLAASKGKIAGLIEKLQMEMTSNSVLNNHLDFVNQSYETLRRENIRLIDQNDRLVNEIIDGCNRIAEALSSSESLTHPCQAYESLQS
jgi:cell division septum initiation protein DivIVA